MARRGRVRVVNAGRSDSPKIKKSAEHMASSPYVGRGSSGKTVVKLSKDADFNKQMKRVARTNPKVRKAMGRAAMQVMASIESEALRHVETGNFIRHIKLSGFDKAGGWRIEATDENAWSIEFGHFVKDDATGVVKKDDDAKVYHSRQVGGTRRPTPDAGTEGTSNAVVGGRIWVEGTHIMREGARRAASHVGTPKKGRLTLK